MVGHDPPHSEGCLMDDAKTPAPDKLPSEDLAYLVGIDDDADDQPPDREDEDEVPA